MKRYKFKIKNIPYILGIVLNYVFALIVSYLFSYLIDKVIVAKDYELLRNWFFITLIITISSQIWNITIGQYQPLKLDLKMSIKISRDALKNLLSMSQSLYSEKEKGYYYNVVTNSAFSYGSMYEQFYVELFANVIISLIVLVLMFFVNLWLGVLFSLYIPIVALFTIKPGNVVARYQEKGMPTQDVFLEGSRNIIESKREINIAKVDDYYMKRYRESSEKFLKFATRFRFYEIIASNIPQFINGTYNVIVLGVATYFYFKDYITLGTIILTYQFLNIYSSPVSEIFRILTRNKVNRPNYERIESLYDKAKVESGFSKLMTGKNFVNIKNFKLYRDSKGEKLLFEGNNIEIDKGDLVIIKGENGSGKSMLVNYLTGYIDVNFGKGELEIAKDISENAYLTYPILVVNGSLHDNLLGIEGDENLKILLGIDFEDKLINSNPINLSYGQQQKLNLLRVLSTESKYVILDEPMSNLDTKTQKNLKNYLVSLKGEKTIVLIMHDDQMDEFADKILRINDKSLYCQI